MNLTTCPRGHAVHFCATSRVMHRRSRAYHTGLLFAVALFLACVSGTIGDEKDNSAELAKLATADHFEAVTNDPGFPVKSTYGLIRGTTPGKSAMQRYAGLFVHEFRLYPPELIRRTQLKRVVFCEKLSFDGQTRNAVPDFEHDTLYLDVSRGGYSRDYLREVIHHEFFHIIDYRDDGQLYTDDAWSALNPPGFKYGNGGKAAQGVATMGVLTDKFPGFLDEYATTAVEEDKAEVFAHMVIDPDYVANRDKTDPVLTAKTKRMKELLVKFCPEMGPIFWKVVADSQEHASTRP